MAVWDDPVDAIHFLRQCKDYKHELDRTDYENLIECFEWMVRGDKRMREMYDETQRRHNETAGKWSVTRQELAKSQRYIERNMSAEQVEIYRTLRDEGADLEIAVTAAEQIGGSDESV